MVLANKKPLAGSWERYDALRRDLGERRPARCRYEATVGAGLPIIDTYHKLVETGDRVLRIEGCVSGTLMYVVSAVSAGPARSRRRSREAVERGYAEPDPRDDLSGHGRGAQGADPRRGCSAIAVPRRAPTTSCRARSKNVVAR